MSIASDIKALIQKEKSNAYSLQYGYAVSVFTGKRVHFPIGNQEVERRTRQGRVIYARYRYGDGSRLEYHFVSGMANLVVKDRERLKA